MNKGDTVRYIDTCSEKVGKRLKTVKVEKWGKWDGEKVECWDRQRSLVRNPEWLEVVNGEIKYMTIDELLDELVWLSEMSGAELICYPIKDKIDEIREMIRLSYHYNQDSINRYYKDK